MHLTRRHLLTTAAAAAIASPAATPLSAFGLDAGHFGVRPGAADDQSRALQGAIDQAVQARVPLMLAPGVYRAGDLKLPAGAHLAGVRGASRLIFTHGPSLLSAEHADSVTLSGLALDGARQALPAGRGLVHLLGTRGVRIADCEIVGPGGNAIALLQCDGDVTTTRITGAADNALFCNESNGLRITDNVIADSGNGGIRVWQSVKRHDGALVADNRIEDTHARAGGNGQNGNAINIFRAADVIVRNNVIRNAAFSAIRGNAASNIQILGNKCAALDDTAIYSEFDFERALIANNLVDGAGRGISVTNFKEGGRLATVRGNRLRNLRVRRQGVPPEQFGIGIGVEADTTVSGNVIENAQTIGIQAGWGPYLRDVAVTGNVLREVGVGVAVSVVAGAGSAVISDNTISGARRGAIFGMEWHKPVTGDLALAGSERYPQLRISSNRVI
jgi:uncharacterized secreted repeat protein (TIGR03808 family)